MLALLGLAAWDLAAHVGSGVYGPWEWLVERPIGFVALSVLGLWAVVYATAPPQPKPAKRSTRVLSLVLDAED